MKIKRTYYFWLTGCVVAAAIASYKVALANSTSEAMVVLQKRKVICLGVEKELSSLNTTKLMQDSPIDYNTITIAHDIIDASGKSAHALQNLYYLKGLAPKSFRSTVSEVLASEMKLTKSENAENVQFMESTLASMTDVPSALAVDHAKKCLNDYQKELDSLR